MTDDPFLAAIQAEPLDRTTRLAYADWLEEQGDSRAELVRVCEWMRDEPVWSDRYWQLKARRNELWSCFPLEWIVATGYDGSYYDPVFRDGVPDEPLARWRLIREFTERWHGVAALDIGGQQDAIRAVEKRLGLSLPPSIRELTAFAHEFGNYWIPDRQSDPIISLFHCASVRVDYLSEHPALGLIRYSLSGSVLGVAIEDLDLPDPPAYVFDEGQVDYDDNGRSILRVPEPRFRAGRLTRAVFDNLFTELPSAGSTSKLLADPSIFLARLKADFPIHAEFDGADVFERDEIFVHVSTPHAYGKLGRHVSVCVRRPLSRASLPAYLFGNKQHGTSSSGVLMSEHHWQRHAANRWREQRWQSPIRRALAPPEAEIAEPPVYPEPPNDGDDPIPF